MRSDSATLKLGCGCSANRVWCDLVELHVRYVQNAVRRDVGGRIVHFVKELLGAGQPVDSATRTRYLRDDDLAGCRHIGKGESEPV